MQCLDYFKSRLVIGKRSVIGTLFATEDGQRLISFFKDEFDLDMNSDPSISTTQHRTTIPYLREGLNILSHKSTCHILVITNAKINFFFFEFFEFLLFT